MPVTLVDRLPLPNLKAYTAGSVLLLSVAVYYALTVTSDPKWRTNVTMVQPESQVPQEKGAAYMVASPPVLGAPNSTRNLTEQFVDVMTFMMQEPLCMWTLINMAYCSLAVFGFVIQHAVFGQLRVAEAQRVKDKFWNYVFYKFIFVFGVINVQYMDEVLLWCSWFTLLGFLHLLGQLCKDRFEYLSSSPTTAPWAHVRLALLLGGILAAGGALLGVAAVFGLPQGRDTFAFMAAECVLVVVCALHVCARYALRLREADVTGALVYYTHLVFDSVSLVVELVHVVHMVVYSNMLVSMASLVLLMQLRHLLHELQARLQRHKLYTERATHITTHCPMASKEEVEKNQDNCAICWEPMKEARKLPCAHLFHNSCLCQWVQQDASCPTCRRALARHSPPSATTAATASAAPGARTARPARPNHLFHFDGSRYVSWLPSFSVEVTRVRAVPAPGQIDAMARQVQQLFPQFPLSALAADLALSRSPDVTLDNILEGRLLPPLTPPESLHQLQLESMSPAPAATPRDATPPPHATTPPPRDVMLSRHPDTPPHAIVDTSTQTLQQFIMEPPPPAVNFSPRAMERELSLQRRKEHLIAAARARYLARRAASSAAHSAPHSAQPSAPHSAQPSAPHSAQPSAPHPAADTHS